MFKRRTRKILDMATPPLMTTYTHHAHLLSILGVNENTEPWIFSSYIQIYADKDLINTSWADFYFPFPFQLRPAEVCPWIFTQKMGRDFFQDNWINFKEAICYFIDKNTYLHVMLDQYYIPNTPSFRKMHYLHDLLIFGYDKEKETFSVAEFDDNYKYSKFEVSFKNINDAFINYKECKNLDYLYGNILLYKLQPSCNYVFDFENVINSVKAYLNGETMEFWKLYSDKYSDHNKNMRIFGIKYYALLSDYVKNCAIEGKNVTQQLFYLLFDHKQLMTLRFKYLSEIGYNYDIIDDLLEIEKNSQIALNLVLKYNLTGNNEIINNIVECIDKIESNEYQVLSNFLQMYNSRGI